MVTGLDNTKVKKKLWKSQMERDIMFLKDLKEAVTQGGKAFGEIIRPKKKENPKLKKMSRK